ncbi:MarR family transcriptional regulator [Streptomyces sp. NPDC002758]
MTAAQNPTDAADHAVTHLAVELVASLGVEGTATLLAIGTLILTAKSKAFRAAEWKAFRWACRATWRLLVALVLLAVAQLRGRGITPTKDERRLLARLAPSHWREHCEARGLDGTITSRPKLTEAGITAAVRLDGTWTVAKLRQAEENVRALLGARTALRIEITPGKRGGWAELVIRTRSAVDSADLRWTPKRVGIGLDAHTGEPVTLPRTRLLLAGSSGAGKSVALRPYLAELCADPKASVILVDAKRVEGALWKTRARIARDAAEIEQVAAELYAEMMKRLELLEAAGKASHTPTVERPTLVVVVDEGAEVLTIAKDAVAAFESVARMGRAAEIHLVWCTQKPTMSGSSAGIPPQIAAQMDVRAALRLATATEVRVVLGEDATAAGWDAHTLPKPGVLMLRGTGRGPAPVKVWYMDDQTVRELPPAPIWRRSTDAGDDEGDAPAVELVKASGAVARVLDVLAAGPVRQKDLAEASGLSKGAVSKAVGRLAEAGRVVRLDDGRVQLAA